MPWKRPGGIYSGSLKNEKAATDGVDQSEICRDSQEVARPCDDELSPRPNVATMMNGITVSPEQAKEIFKAINGIGELLKRLPAKPEDAPMKHAIMLN